MLRPTSALSTFTGNWFDVMRHVNCVCNYKNTLNWQPLHGYNSLNVRLTKTTLFGPCAFGVSGLNTWNDLPATSIVLTQSEGDWIDISVCYTVMIDQFCIILRWINITHQLTNKQTYDALKCTLIDATVSKRSPTSFNLSSSDLITKSSTKRCIASSLNISRWPCKQNNHKNGIFTSMFE